MGGATALGLAERHPDRLDRVIVCNSPCQSTPQSSQQWEERIAVAAETGNGGAGRADDGALVPARDPSPRTRPTSTSCAP